MTVKFARVPRAGSARHVLSIMRQSGLYLAAHIVLSSVPVGRQKKENIFRTQGMVFGPAVDISVFGESETRTSALATTVLNEFAHLRQKFRAWQSSALTVLNDSVARGNTYQADAEMVEQLKAATTLAENSHNTLNPAIRHLFRLLGFVTSVEQIQARVLTDIPSRSLSLARRTGKCWRSAWV